MTKGVLGIIICPMLEDELVYSIRKDDEIGRVVLLDNPHSSGLRSKLEKTGTRFELVPEADFDAGKVEFDRSIYNIVIKANDLALHSEPANLKAHIEKQVTDIQPLVDALGLYYGLCGNYGWDISAWCREKGFKPASVFRSLDGRVCDDCVCVALGGTERYLALEKKYTGMLYVIPSIASNWEPFLMAGDDAKSIAALPEETKEELGIVDIQSFMRWMFEFCGYKNSLKIDTGLDTTGTFDQGFLDLSEMMNLKPLVIEDGWVTLDSVEGIYESCKKNLG
ncbi:MAG: DUF1638 domain-containing protein [archaeon]|nr:DUF1638 domain-containing protein [archaeon]